MASYIWYTGCVAFTYRIQINKINLAKANPTRGTGPQVNTQWTENIHKHTMKSKTNVQQRKKV